MSSYGLLRPSEVVFYHPLDNFTESTQSQMWTGFGGFVPGKIPAASPLGLSAVTADAAAWGTIYSTGGPHNPGRGAIIRLSSTRAVIVYRGAGAMARVVTVSGDITVGPEFLAGASSGSGQEPAGAAFSDTKIVLHWRNGANLIIRAGTVSGNDITFGAATSILSGQPTGNIAAISSTKGVMVYGIYSPTVEVMVTVIDIVGTSMTVGPAVQLTDTGANPVGADVSKLDSARVVAVWNNSSSIQTAVLTASGTSITVGSVIDIVGQGGSNVSVVALSSTKVAYVWLISSGPGQQSRIGDVSGTTITLGSTVSVSTNIYHGGMGMLSSSAFIVCGTNGSGRWSWICTVSGSTISVGGASQTTSISNYGGATEALSETLFLHMGTSELVLGTIGTEASMVASTPGAYPAVTGDDRVVVAMWAKNVTKGSSTVTVQRDYKVDLTAISVTLGPASTVWSAAAISDTLMGTDAGEMNDGLDHLLVLDFEHTGGGSWVLRTSVDGAAWVNQGAGTGTRSTAPASAGPTLGIADGEVAQWIDELIMWSGDKSTFSMFTSEELANLYDLADTFFDGMQGYEENYGAPICWQATARLLDGTVWRDSGSGLCPSVIRVPRGAEDIVVTDDGKMVSPRIQEG